MNWSRRPIDFERHFALEDVVERGRPVHLWFFDLDSRPVQAVDRLILSADELRKSHRLKDPVHSERSLASSVLMRRVLGKALDVNPAGLHFVKDACGKPSLAAHPPEKLGDEKVNFNISHSENVLVVAVAFDCIIGVDVEVIDSAKDKPSFYRAWTMKEAMAKLDGRGITTQGYLFSASAGIVDSFRSTFAGREIAVALATRSLYGTFRMPLREKTPSISGYPT